MDARSDSRRICGMVKALFALLFLLFIIQQTQKVPGLLICGTSKGQAGILGLKEPVMTGK